MGEKEKEKCKRLFIFAIIRLPSISAVAHD
jgi:hypothetical protein